MTARAGANDLCVIDRGCRYGCPLCREAFMAGITQRCRIYVCRTLARCSNAVMAGNTVIHERRMINGRGYPLTGAVTAIALRCRRNMTGRFARCDYVVMTARTHAQHFGVINTGGL